MKKKKSDMIILNKINGEYIKFNQDKIIKEYLEHIDQRIEKYKQMKETVLKIIEINGELNG